MADSDKIKEIVNQADRVVMMAFRDTETGPQPATAPNQQENQAMEGLVLEKETFNLDV